MTNSNILENVYTRLTERLSGVPSKIAMTKITSGSMTAAPKSIKYWTTLKIISTRIPSFKRFKGRPHIGRAARRCRG